MEIVHGPSCLTGTGTNGTTKTEAENSLSNKKDEKREQSFPGVRPELVLFDLPFLCFELLKSSGSLVEI